MLRAPNPYQYISMREIFVIHTGQTASATSFFYFTIMHFSAWRLPHHFPSLVHSCSGRIKPVSDCISAPFFPSHWFLTSNHSVKQKCFPINVTNEKCISEETNTFSSIKCHSYLCCKKWWSTSVRNEELMEGRPNVFGSEEVLFSHSIILYITGELHESTKSECISPAESNPRC